MKKIMLLLISFGLLIPGYSFAATQNIHLEWTFDYQPIEGRTLAGYNLYKEGIKVCSTNTPTDRAMDCTIESEDGTFDFTLTAFCSDGMESPHSPSYTFALTATPETPPSTFNIHFDWTYDQQDIEGRTLAGYNLYKEGVKICTSNTPTERSMNCSFDSEEGTYDFTLTAFSTDGYESSHSNPYPLTLATVSEPIVLAAFNTTPTSLTGDVPFSIAFDASASSGNIASYSWDFGDNSSGSSSQASHTYNTAGSFNATLTIIGTNGATSQKSVVITVAPAPVAVIATTPTSLSGDIPFTVSFNGSGSAGNISSYSWNFGDNSSSSGSQVSHTFNTAGTLNATLTVTSANGTVSQDSVAITVSPAPVAAIITDPTSLSGDAPFAVSFDAASSTGDIASYTWGFGDNSSGSGSQTNHTFATAGTFTTTLTVTSANGTTSQKTVTVNVSPTPVAAFTTNPTELTGNTPLTVSFDASTTTGNISSYAWNFGDNSSGSGSQTSHSYSTAGSFSATLTVTSSNGTTSQKSVTIVTTDPSVPPVAVISPTTLSGDAPLTVSFDGSSSTSTASYAWSFGDGATASASQINHIFTIAGTYTTTLTVTNAEGLTNSQSVTVTANEAIVENTPPTAVIGSTSAVGDAPLGVDFDGSASHDSEGAISSYLWNFGDGSQTTTGSIATHSYTVPGTYSASLTVTDSEGAQNTTSTPVMITGQLVENEAPTARMTTSETEGTTPLQVNFDGSTSTDPEASALTYSWNFGDGASGQGMTTSHLYTSPGSFTATLTVTDDTGSTASTTTTITTSEEEIPVFQIELGEVEIDNNWMRVDFSAPFITPVVVAGPPSTNDSAQCTIRLRNITSTGFDIRLQEWNYQDDIHAKETVAYFVMEQGNFTLDDGTMIEARQFTSNDTNFQTVQFNTFFTVEPVIMASIATFNEEDTVTNRLRNISTTSFEHKTQGQELATEHGSETVNYIAWEPSRSSIDSINVIVNKTNDKVRNRWYTIDYDEQLADLPIFLGTMQSQDGLDTSTVRYINKTTTEIQVMIEEEQSLDDETRHTSETVGYFLFFSNSTP